MAGKINNMIKYLGQIRNEQGKVIFSRKGKFDGKQSCISALKERVYNDIPIGESLIYNMIFGGDFSSSPYCLSRHYSNITKLTFHAYEL